MATIIVNTTELQVVVPVTHVETGAQDSIHLQPISRAALPSGYEVTDENFKASHPGIQVVEG